MIQTNKLEEQKINWKYYKIFIFLNKKNIELAKKEVANNKDLHRFLSEQLSFLISKIK